MIGQTISHYKILQTLGFGAMSTIYKAQDLRLDRFVALKFLTTNIGIDQEDKERLIQEAKTTSALEHPNICTIYEIDQTPTGQVFISMAYYQGETLKDLIAKGPLSEKEAIYLFKQIALGMSKAHSKGIVHRDIKPANIMVTEDRVVKILDFGIAKILNQSTMTLPGTIMGTPGYMAPEQAKGQEIDHRSDIWALGVLFFEMLTGELPFTGDNYAAFIYSITSDKPRELCSIRTSVNRGIQEIIDKTLEKDPLNRFQTVDEIIEALESIESRRVSVGDTVVNYVQPKTTPSIAVLPFVDLSEGAGQSYFCDGLTEEIINTLSRVDELRVVSRSSAFQFRGPQQDLRKIGLQLNVQYILEGSIRKWGDKIRISIRLTNASDGFVLWSDQLEFKFEDVFEVQDSISNAVVDNLRLELLGDKANKIFKRYTENAEAYNHYLQGRYHWNKRTMPELEAGIACFKSALECDPDYSLAYAGLADSYIIIGLYGMLPPKSVMEDATRTAQKALQLDEELAEAHATLGCLNSVYRWDWSAAEMEFKRAIELNSNYPIAHHWYAINYLTPMKQFDRAMAEMKRALNLDPISLVVNVTVGLTYYFAGQYDLAMEYYKKSLKMEPDFAIAHFFLGQALVQRGLFKEAVKKFRRAVELFGNSPNMLSNLGFAAAKAGREDITKKILNTLLNYSKTHYVSGYDVACLFIALKDFDQAFSWLEKAVEERAYLLIYLGVDPLLNDLRGDDRFPLLLNRVGINP